MDDPEFRDLEDIGDLASHRLIEIKRSTNTADTSCIFASRFFEDYKKNENKSVKVDEIKGAAEAVAVVQAAMANHPFIFPFASPTFLGQLHGSLRSKESQMNNKSLAL